MELLPVNVLESWFPVYLLRACVRGSKQVRINIVITCFIRCVVGFIQCFLVNTLRATENYGNLGLYAELRARRFFVIGARRAHSVHTESFKWRKVLKL